MKIPFANIKSLSKVTSINNFIHLSLNQGTNVIVALVITPYLFQTLGEDQYGLVSLGLTVILLFGIVVNYGFNLNVPKKLALLDAEPKVKEELINDVVVTRLFSSILLIVLIFSSVRIFGVFSGYSTIIVFASIQLINEAIFPMFVLQGFDRLSWISKANAISKLLYLALVLLAVKGEADAKWVNFFLGSTGVLVHGVLLIYIYRSEGLNFEWVSIQRIKYRLVDNFQFFSSTVAAYILVNGGFILLNSFVSNAELGFYALAQRVSLLLRMIPVFLAQSILQSASRLYKQDLSQFENYLKRSCNNGLLITFCVGLVCAVSSTWIVRILAGEFIPLSADLMKILCFLPFLGMLNVSNMIRILVAEQKHLMAKAIWITTLIMFLLGSAGAYYFGSFGLAWTLLIVEAINFLIHRYLIRKSRVISR